VNKRVSGLESLLGVKLLTRSNRKLSLIKMGSGYLKKCLFILAQIDEADAAARTGTALPKGAVKIAAPIPIARIVLPPLIKSFIEQYPEIKIDLAASDVQIDLIAQSIDIAIRAKKSEDSSLVTRYLFDNKMALVASPYCWQYKNMPTIAEGLKWQNCIAFHCLTLLTLGTLKKMKSVQRRLRVVFVAVIMIPFWRLL